MLNVHINKSLCPLCPTWTTCSKNSLYHVVSHGAASPLADEDVARTATFVCSAAVQPEAKAADLPFPQDTSRSETNASLGIPSAEKL
jgi:hypothetical protein